MGACVHIRRNKSVEEMIERRLWTRRERSNFRAISNPSKECNKHCGIARFRQRKGLRHIGMLDLLGDEEQSEILKSDKSMMR